jgi:hypothetical protein
MGANVLVWFHPGAYSSDTSNRVETDGARLSRRGDVVVVTVNHRLNAFGYLYLAELGGEEFADSGNAGMLDLVLAPQSRRMPARSSRISTRADSGARHSSTTAIRTAVMAHQRPLRVIFQRLTWAIPPTRRLSATTS